MASSISQWQSPISGLSKSFIAAVSSLDPRVTWTRSGTIAAFHEQLCEASFSLSGLLYRNLSRSLWCATGGVSGEQRPVWRISSLTLAIHWLHHYNCSLCSFYGRDRYTPSRLLLTPYKLAAPAGSDLHYCWTYSSDYCISMCYILYRWRVSRHSSPGANLDYDFGSYTTQESHSGFCMSGKVRMYYFWGFSTG
jgi:hypothetical protein